MDKAKGTNTNDVQAANAVYTEEHATTAIIATETKAVAKLEGGAYITGLLQTIKDDFIAANDGLDMDFVYMGTWLVIDKKGNFVEKDDDTIKYGDSIDVVVGQGEKRWSLWGLEKSPEDGQLIVACKEKPDAEQQLTEWLEANPEAQSSYSTNNLELRYIAYVVPVATLVPDDFPKIYLMSFAPTSTISWGKYAMKVYQGGYKLQGIPARTGVNKVVTRLETQEKQGKSNTSWIGIDFSAVGMFNPADYGIKETPIVNVEAEQK